MLIAHITAVYCLSYWCLPEEYPRIGSVSHETSSLGTDAISCQPETLNKAI